MTERQFRQMAIACDGATEGEHMGHPDFRAHGRVFATLRFDRKSGVVKLTPEQQQRFTGASAALTPESGAWGRSGYTRVVLADVDAESLGEALTLAWQNTARLRGRPVVRRSAKTTGAGRVAKRKMVR